jgi:hypothetical protein
MAYRIVRVVVAIAVVVASLPLSLIAMERGFGPGGGNKRGKQKGRGNKRDGKCFAVFY